jgi:hypothetical protein
MSEQASLRAGFNRWRQIRAFLAMFFVMPIMIFLLVALVGSKLGAMSNPGNGAFLVVLVIAIVLPVAASLIFLRRALRRGDGLRIDDDGLFLPAVGRIIVWPDIREIRQTRLATSDNSVITYSVKYTESGVEKNAQIDTRDLVVNRQHLRDVLHDRGFSAE